MSKAYFYTIIDPLESDNTSGGPQAAKSIISNVENCGYSVEIITPKTSFLEPENSSFNIYHDMFNDPHGSSWFTSDQIRRLKYTSTPFFFSECAYTACTTSPYGDTSFGGQNLIPLTSYLMKKAVKFITASPMHGKTIEGFVGSPLKNIYPYLVEVNTRIFKEKGIKKDIEYLTVGAMNKWKGTDIACKKYGDELVVIGYGDVNLIKNNASFIGKIPNEDLVDWYNRSKNFVHLPTWKESFSITTAEAFLCGCNVIVNENVGAMSFNEDLSNPDTYKKSVSLFKEMVEREIGRGSNYLG